MVPGTEAWFPTIQVSRKARERLAEAFQIANNSNQIFKMNAFCNSLSCVPGTSLWRENWGGWQPEKQDTSPSHARREMLKKSPQFSLLRLWKWHPQSELVCNNPFCKRPNKLQHIPTPDSSPLCQGPKLHSPLQHARLNTIEKHKPIGWIIPATLRPWKTRSLWSRVSSSDAWKNARGRLLSVQVQGFTL